MKIEELKLSLSSNLTKRKVLKLAESAQKNDLNVNDLIELSFDEDQQTGFRAAWIIENILLADPLAIVENLDELILRLPHVSNQSCQRHYAKIMMHLTSPKIVSAIQTKMEIADLEPVIETLFDWLINPKTDIAVKAFCCEVLFNLRKRYDWITDELVQEVKFLMQDGSPGIQSKGKKILAALKKD